MENMSIAQSLISHRITHGYSIECVSAALGISPDKYVEFELAVFCPSADQMLALVRFYGSTLDCMYGVA